MSGEALILFIWLALGAMAALIAFKKGRSVVGFGFLGLLLGPLGVILAGLVSPNYRGTIYQADRVPCYECHESIHRDARRCRFCGAEQF